MLSLTCPGTAGIVDQKYDELKWESSIISAMTQTAAIHYERMWKSEQRNVQALRSRDKR